MSKNNLLLNRMKKTLNKRRGLNESLIFDEEDKDIRKMDDFFDENDFDENDFDENDFDEDDSDKNDYNRPSNNNDNTIGGGKEIIDEIRMLALKGLQALAKTPEAPEYETFKKIWQFVDKTLTEQPRSKEDENNKKNIK